MSRVVDGGSPYLFPLTALSHCFLLDDSSGVVLPPPPSISLSLPPREGLGKRIRVCQLAMADVRGGAESQLGVLLASLSKIPELEISAVLLNEGSLSTELRELGRVSTHVISESDKSPSVIFHELRSYFATHDVDILHTHKYKDNILGNLASVGRGIRGRVRTVHGLSEPFAGFDRAKMFLYEALDYAINKSIVDRMIAVSLDMQSQLSKRFDPRKVTCVHNGIDLAHIRTTKKPNSLRSELGLGGDDVVIGTMGRLVPVKGLQHFLMAAQIIRRQRKDVKFLVVGDGPLLPSLKELARKTGIHEHTLFPGYRRDSYDMLALMDVFVLPSLTEGIPMVLLEALALQRPVVASRAGGIPEIIEHGVSGLLVTIAEPEELARSCLSLLEDHDLARRLGTAGRKRVEEQFSASAMAEGVASIYKTLI